MDTGPEAGRGNPVYKPSAPSGLDEPVDDGGVRQQLYQTKICW